MFLQVHVAAEETKFGFTPEELDAEITPELLAGLRATEITGVMGMATNTDDTPTAVRADFRAIRAAFELLKPRIAGLRDISMGMTTTISSLSKKGRQWCASAPRYSARVSIRIDSPLLSDNNLFP